MPVGGLVVTSRPEETKDTEASLSGMEGVSVYGSDEKGNIIAVLDTQSSEDMEALIKKINGVATVLNVGLTYLNVEDEADRIVIGEYSPRIFGDRRDKKDP